MSWLEQLELFDFCSQAICGIGTLPIRPTRRTQVSPRRGRDVQLEQAAGEVLRPLGATRLGALIRVEWNGRLKSCAGRADYRQKQISLNPRLHEHPDEIGRTLRHELAHLLAQFRAGRRRILPHGPEWRAACRDLGIADEKRCHNLPFPVKQFRRRYLYRCPGCRREFPRVRQVRRAVACLACCRAHSRGKFDPRFKLRLIGKAPSTKPN
jgi:SprT protein